MSTGRKREIMRLNPSLTDMLARQLGHMPAEAWPAKPTVDTRIANFRGMIDEALSG